ncbi:hypothetical protein D3C86_2141700 [compost metagenome]
MLRFDDNGLTITTEQRLRRTTPALVDDLHHLAQRARAHALLFQGENEAGGSLVQCDLTRPGMT